MSKIDEENLTDFMKDKQIKLGHPFNLFEYLQAVSDFYQIIDIAEGKITEEQFNTNKKIAKLCFESIINILKDFEITEKDGCLLDYFKDKE